MTVCARGRESLVENDPLLPPEYPADPSIMELQLVRKSWRDLHRVYVAEQQRYGTKDLVLLKSVEKRARRVQKLMRALPLSAFITETPGMGSVYGATVICAIRDPHRFPSKRHLWRYLGLAPGEDGKALRRKRGQVANWHGEARAALLMPEVGIVRQQVRFKTRYYEGVYLPTKQRITEREAVAWGEIESSIGLPDSLGVERSAELVSANGSQNGSGREAEADCVSDVEAGLPPWHIEKIACNKVAKELVADLWAYWRNVA